MSHTLHGKVIDIDEAAATGKCAMAQPIVTEAV
jgi:hypothetical protein